MGLNGLAILILHQVSHCAVQHARAAQSNGRRVTAGIHAVAASLKTVNLNRRIVQERVEQTNRVRTATHAGSNTIGQAASLSQNLLARLLTDSVMEETHHRRERVRTRSGTQQVVGVLNVRNPVAQRLINGVLEGAGTVLNRNHLRAQQLHTSHVQRLTLSVFLAHVDHALHAEERSRSRSRNTVLTRTGLSNQTGLTHTLSQQSLTNHVINLVATRVVQVLTLEEHTRTSMLRELRNLSQQRRTVRILSRKTLELGNELGVVLRLVKGCLQLIHGGNQRLGHPPPAVLTKIGAGGILQRLAVEESICQVLAHHYSFPGWLPPDARRG